MLPQPTVMDILLIVVVYLWVFVIILMGEFLRRRLGDPMLTRKLIHLLAGDSIVAIGWMSSPIWPALIPVGLIMLLSIAFLFKKDSSLSAPMLVEGMDRTHLYGPLYYILCILALLIFWPRKDVIVASTFVLAWGDGLAPIIAGKIGRTEYPFSKKTLEGSLVVFTFGALGAAVGLWILSFSGFPVGDVARKSLIGGIVGCVSEALSIGPLKGFDNVIVPLAVAAALLMV